MPAYGITPETLMVGAFQIAGKAQGWTIPMEVHYTQPLYRATRIVPDPTNALTSSIRPIRKSPLEWISTFSELR